MGAPEEVLQAYFEHMRHARYIEAANLMCEQVVTRFVEDDVPHLRPHDPPTVEGYLERQPDLPVAVAEFWVSNSRRHTVSWEDYFAGVQEESDLNALSHVELYARHLEATDHGARYARLVDALRNLHPEYEDQLLALRETQRGWRWEVLGCLQHSRRAYVLFGQPLPSDDLILREPAPFVAVLRPAPEGWRLAVDPNPFSGVGMLYGTVEVQGPDGEPVFLDPHEPT